MRKAPQTALGLAVVIVGMAPLFAFPKAEFALATLLSTSVMVAVAVASRGYRKLFAPRGWKIALGLAVAGALYLLFFLGNASINAYHPFGMGASEEGSIYGLIASAGNPLPLQVLVLAFDTLGFESYFRGTLQTRLGGSLGLGAPFAAAAVDALVHVASFNPLWVVATFIVDSAWGLVFYRSGDLASSMASHFVWDVAIFIILPIG